MLKLYGESWNSQNEEKMKIIDDFWWLGAESNCPPMGYESIALTN
jgi:hypothetical protein